MKTAIRNDVRRCFIDVTTGQLHLRVAGHAQPDAASPKSAIICLHMMPKSGRSFERLMPQLLGSGHLVIAPDYPGYGESSHFPIDHKPSIADYADSIEEVIEHFALEQVNLVGYHTGSMVAVELAYRHPKLVSKLINISAPILSKQEIDDFHQYFAPVALDKAGTRFTQMWQRIQYFAGPGMTLEMAAQSMAENLRGGERYEDGHAAAFDYSMLYAQRLQNIEQAVWIMNFGDDLFEHSKRADELLNNGTRSDFPDFGHGSLDLWPQEIAQHMLSFFNE